jgi:hypothetical protein
MRGARSDSNEIQFAKVPVANLLQIRLGVERVLRARLLVEESVRGSARSTKLRHYPKSSSLNYGAEVCAAIFCKVPSWAGERPGRLSAFCAAAAAAAGFWLAHEPMTLAKA